jgi:pimeloyl-ACP methyl ester carboxylesterase
VLTTEDMTALAEAYTWKGCSEIPALVRMMGAADPRVRSDLGQQMATGQFDDEQAMIREAHAPVGVVQGADDPLIARTFLEQLAPGLFWQDRVHLIADAGHSPQLQRPAAFAAVLRNFVEAA